MRGFTDETTPYQRTFECLGAELRVCASEEDVLERIERILPLDRIDGGSILTAHRMGIVSELDGTFSVYNQSTRISEGGGLELALVALEGTIRSYISIAATGLIFIRGGAVGYDGRAILLPGNSFSGKSTLVAALVDAGARYYSEDYAPIDSDGHVHRFRGPADSRATSGAVTPLPLRIGLVVSTYFVPGAEWQPTTIEGSAAALEVLSDTVTVVTRPAEAMQALKRVFEGGAQLLKGERGEAGDLAPLLLEQLSQVAAS